MNQLNNMQNKPKDKKNWQNFIKINKMKDLNQTFQKK